MASFQRLTEPLVVNQSRIPRFVYGTAWKKDGTMELVTEALRAGFTGVDTACQPRHYREELVGAGITKAINLGVVKREALYIQTKFTSVVGQDAHNIPYDPISSVEAQIDTSIATSLQNLRIGSSSVPYIDTLVLHSPLETLDLTERAWHALERHVPHEIRALGISNFDVGKLEALYDAAIVKPVVVQNRFYPQNLWDYDVRRYCEAKDIVYQSFWTLTANPPLLRSDPVSKVAHAVNVSRAAALYLCVMGLGNISVLNGTTSTERMAEDLASLKAWDQWISQGGNEAKWAEHMKAFRTLIGDVEETGKG